MPGPTIARASVTKNSQLPRRGGFAPLVPVPPGSHGPDARQRVGPVTFITLPQLPPLDLTFQTVPAFALHQTNIGSALVLHSYSPNLPPLRLPGCHTRSSAVRVSHVMCSLLRLTAPPFSQSCHRYAYPGFAWFQCREIPKPVTYPAQLFNELPITSFEATAQLTSTKLPHPKSGEPLHA